MIKQVLVTDALSQLLDKRIQAMLDQVLVDLGSEKTGTDISYDSILDMKEQLAQALRVDGDIELVNLLELTVDEFNEQYYFTYAATVTKGLTRTPEGGVQLEIQSGMPYNLQIWERDGSRRLWHKQNIPDLMTGIQEFCTEHGYRLTGGDTV